MFLIEGSLGNTFHTATRDYRLTLECLLSSPYNLQVHWQERERTKMSIWLQLLRLHIWPISFERCPATLSEAAAYTSLTPQYIFLGLCIVWFNIWSYIQKQVPSKSFHKPCSVPNCQLKIVWLVHFTMPFKFNVGLLYPWLLTLAIKFLILTCGVAYLIYNYV